MPYFGFKAKPGRTLRRLTDIVLCLILDSRQNYSRGAVPLDSIVLCLILDSRQNAGVRWTADDDIVLCLILDSRQNVRQDLQC